MAELIFSKWESHCIARNIGSSKARLKIQIRTQSNRKVHNIRAFSMFTKEACLKLLKHKNCARFSQSTFL